MADRRKSSGNKGGNDKRFSDKPSYSRSNSRSGSDKRSSHPKSFGDDTKRRDKGMNLFDKDELAPPRFLAPKPGFNGKKSYNDDNSRKPYSKGGDSKFSKDNDRKPYGRDRSKPFGEPNNRDSDSRDKKPWDRDKKPFDSRDSKPWDRDKKPFDSRDKKPWDRDKKPFDSRDSKPWDRDKKSFDSRDSKPWDKDKKPWDKDKKPYDSGEKKTWDKDRKPFDPNARKQWDKDRKPYDANDKREFNSTEKKPFRPKYDPEVKTKKSFRERKLELTGPPPPSAEGEMRLNKFIANSGICSRREADEVIKQGLVSVNQEVITEMGHRVKKEDVVRYDGRKILPEPYVYILMNKPKDFITTTEDDKGRKTVMDLLADKVSQRVFPIGRLDRNTTGVLLFTNDGDVAQMMTHPSFNIKKIYHVVLDKKVSGTDLDKLVEGVELEDGIVHADAVSYVESEDKRHVGVEIHSGRNRVVRRMFESLGYEVEKLDRVGMGIFTKKDLPRGKWRHLSQSEMGFLLKMKSKL